MRIVDRLNSADSSFENHPVGRSAQSKRKYDILLIHGYACTSAHLSLFLQGQERVAAIGESIPEVSTTPPWDGGDGQVLEEEEFSLEDLMGDEEPDKSEL